MLADLFQASSIPILQEVVSFAQARHTVLAGNIANVNTPGYEARDLSIEDFQTRLKEAIDERQQGGIRSPGELTARKPLMAEVANSSRTLLRHDLGKVDMETQVSEMIQNQMQHNLALTIMTDQFRQLQMAISGKV